LLGTSPDVFNKEHVPMPSKKSTRMAKVVAETKVAEPKVAETKSVRPKSAIGPKGSLLIAACVVAGGMLVAARQPPQPSLKATPRMDSVPMPDPPAKSVIAASTARNAAAVSESPASPAKTATATVTGCLERDGDGFRLKAASGDDAPKARSWKSAFLKKGPAAIEVVDGTHSLRLSDQVGRRVSVTGSLDGREMTARSLRRVAASCDAK
jgi:hypothetical protein